MEYPDPFYSLENLPFIVIPSGYVSIIENHPTSHTIQKQFEKSRYLVSTISVLVTGVVLNSNEDQKFKAVSKCT